MQAGAGAGPEHGSPPFLNPVSPSRPLERRRSTSAGETVGATLGSRSSAATSKASSRPSSFRSTYSGVGSMEPHQLAQGAYINENDAGGDGSSWGDTPRPPPSHAPPGRSVSNPLARMLSGRHSITKESPLEKAQNILHSIPGLITVGCSTDPPSDKGLSSAGSGSHRLRKLSQASYDCLSPREHPSRATSRGGDVLPPQPEGMHSRRFRRVSWAQLHSGPLPGSEVPAPPAWLGAAEGTAKSSDDPIDSQETPRGIRRLPRRSATVSDLSRPLPCLPKPHAEPMSFQQLVADVADRSSFSGAPSVFASPMLNSGDGFEDVEHLKPSLLHRSISLAKLSSRHSLPEGPALRQKSEDGSSQQEEQPMEDAARIMRCRRGSQSRLDLSADPCSLHSEFSPRPKLPSGQSSPSLVRLLSSVNSSCPPSRGTSMPGLLTSDDGSTHPSSTVAAPPQQLHPLVGAAQRESSRSSPLIPSSPLTSSGPFPPTYPAPKLRATQAALPTIQGVQPQASKQAVPVPPAEDRPDGASSLVAAARRRNAWLDAIHNKPGARAGGEDGAAGGGAAKPVPDTPPPKLQRSYSRGDLALAAIAAARAGGGEEDKSCTMERECETARSEKQAAMERMKMRNEQVAKANPAAFSEQAAQAEDAKWREATAAARARLAALAPGITDTPQGFGDSLRLIQASRPFYVAPLPAKKGLEKRAYVPPIAAPPHVWHLEESIFWRRRAENDARSLYDTAQVLDKQFDMDFARTLTKSRFKKMLAREDESMDAGGLQELRDVLRKHAAATRAIYAYFSCLSGHATSMSILTLRMHEFHRFAIMAGISDKKSAGCKPADLDRMWTATSFAGEEEAQNTVDDNTLCRFEFLEVLVRMAVGKYITPKTCTSVCVSVSKLFEDCIHPNLGHIAQLDSNAFKQRMYCEDMELVVLKHWDLLQAIFKVYKAKDHTNRMWIEHWIDFLDSISGIVAGVDKFCAKLIFVLSQMTVVDELKRRQRAVSLVFFDMVEALARLSEVVALPAAQGSQGSAQHLQPLRALISQPVRPLVESFTPFMRCLGAEMQRIWGGTTEAQTAKKMSEQAAILSDGIELKE